MCDLARQPFQVGPSTGISVELPDGVESVIDAATVPPGKRLVVQHLSGRITLPQSQSPRFVSLAGSVGGQSHAHSVPFRFLVSAPFGYLWYFGEELTMYADDTNAVIVNVVRNNSTGSGFFSWTLSGYLVDV